MSGKSVSNIKKNKAGLIHGLYAITDAELTADKDLFSAVEAAILGGAKVIQYRNKSASNSLQYQQAEQLRTLCQQQHVLFIINDDPALAAAVNADGVHVGRDDGKIADARQQLGPHAIIGVSCYNQLKNAEDAIARGADYVAFGRFFPSQTKPHALQAELSLLDQARRHLSVPIVAIGGITLHNAPQLITHGADAIAVIHSLFHNKQEIMNTAKAYQALFNKQ